MTTYLAYYCNSKFCKKSFLVMADNEREAKATYSYITQVPKWLTKCSRLSECDRYFDLSSRVTFQVNSVEDAINEVCRLEKEEAEILRKKKERAEKAKLEKERKIDEESEKKEKAEQNKLLDEAKAKATAQAQIQTIKKTQTGEKIAVNASAKKNAALPKSEADKKVVKEK